MKIYLIILTIIFLLAFVILRLESGQPSKHPSSNIQQQQSKSLTKEEFEELRELLRELKEAGVGLHQPKE